jgi:putative transposase
MKVSPSYRIEDRHALDEESLSAALAENQQLLLPILGLFTEGKAMLDEVIHKLARSTIGAFLELSAREVAGEPRPGKPDPGKGGIYRYGYQDGVVPLGSRKVRIRKPRLRTRATPDRPSREEPVPLYQKLREDPRAGEHVLRLMSRGVSTRDYGGALEEMAGTLGVSKSAVSREFIERTETAHDELMARRFDEEDILVIYIDGKLFGDHHAITALGINARGEKRVLGVVHGASENAAAVKELLRGMVERGIQPGPARLFIIDGSRAIRAAINEVYGSENPVQRCTVHKVRNVQDQLPEEKKRYAKMVIDAAARMPAEKGLAKLTGYADELEEQYPQAAASLREGLDELFTVSRLDLPELLANSLRSTNVIESPQGLISKYTGRVKNWKTPQMVLRWHAAACLDAEKRMKRVKGYADLALLEHKLRSRQQKLRKVA